jgi:hypothetical protein
MAFFGAEVRRARLAARMSLADLGALAFCDASTVSRYESADLPPEETFAATCDRAFPAAGGWFTRFFAAHWTWDASPFPAAFRSFAADEARASALYLFQHSLILGLQGGFSVAEIAGSSGSVALDDINDGRVSGEAAAVTEASVRFRWLQAEALPTAASLALIEQRAGQWQNSTPRDGARLLTAVPEAGTAPR